MTKEMLKLLPHEIRSFFNQEINGQRIIDIVATGSYTEDTTVGPLAEVGDCVAPWLEHFWQQNLGEEGLHYPKTNLIAPCVSLVHNRASYLRATDYWDNYILGNHKNWQSKSAIEKEEALHFLGRVIHLLQDMSTPAHTNNDMHVTIGEDYGFLIDWWDDDDYEDYVGEECDPSIPYKYQISHNLKTFNESNWSIHDFFHNLAKETIKYDSDDKNGKGSGLPYRYPYWTLEEDTNGNNFFRDEMGDLTDWACNAIAKNMMPLSYSYTSSLLIKFLTDLDVFSTGHSILGKKVKLNIQIDNLIVFKNQDNFGSGEMILKVINGVNDSHIDKNDIPVLNNINSGQQIFCNYAIGEREIKQGEAIKLYIEIHDDDNTIDDFVGRATFDITYDNIKDYINGDNKLIVTSGDTGMQITLSIRATAEESENENQESQEALEFYRVNIKSLDKESGGSWYFNLGKDDVVVQNFSRTTTHAILSSHETIKLIEEDFMSANDDVNDFKWERWKDWINQRKHIEPIKIKGSSGQHRIQLNIEKYTKPLQPYHIESNKFEVDGYLHSIETPMGNNKYKIDIRKSHAIEGVFISKEADIIISVPLGGTLRQLFISNNEWTRWIKEKKGLYTKQIGGVKYNFIIFLKAIKSTYNITSYLDKIHVIYDNDDAWLDWGEIYAKYYIDGNMKKKYDLGTLDGGNTYSKNRLLEKNEIFEEGESINFDIKVLDYDSNSKDDSLGTVKVNIPYSEWSNWRDRSNHITGYIKSSDGDCRLTFRFQIKENTFTRKSLPITKEVTNIASNIVQTIDSELVIATPYIPIPPNLFEFSETLKKLPKYNEVKAKLQKPLVNGKALKMDTENTYYYDPYSQKIVFHKKECAYLGRIRRPKALYLMKEDIFKIQSTKNRTLFHPYYALKKLEDELDLLPKKISREYIGVLIKKELIHPKSDKSLIREMFTEILKTPKKVQKSINISNTKQFIESTEYKQIIAQLVPHKDNEHLSIIKKELTYGNLKTTLLKNKIEKLKEIRSTLSKKDQRDIYNFKNKIYKSSFCKCCYELL
jgi:hypothetical protein